jgi:hypothetical protein
MQKIEILHIAECPSWRDAAARVRSVLSALEASTVAIETRLLSTPDEAAQVAFAGSPTILIDGVDAFPSEGATTDLACRIYFTGNRFAGLPTEAQLTVVLRAQL